MPPTKCHHEQSESWPRKWHKARSVDAFCAPSWDCNRSYQTNCKCKYLYMYCVHGSQQRVFVDENSANHSSWLLKNSFLLQITKRLCLNNNEKHTYAIAREGDFCSKLDKSTRILPDVGAFNRTFGYLIHTLSAVYIIVTELCSNDFRWILGRHCSVGRYADLLLWKDTTWRSGKERLGERQRHQQPTSHVWKDASSGKTSLSSH